MESSTLEMSGGHLRLRCKPKAKRRPYELGGEILDGKMYRGRATDICGNKIEFLEMYIFAHTTTLPSASTKYWQDTMMLARELTQTTNIKIQMNCTQLNSSLYMFTPFPQTLVAIMRWLRFFTFRQKIPECGKARYHTVKINVAGIFHVKVKTLEGNLGVS